MKKENIRILRNSAIYAGAGAIGCNIGSGAPIIIGFFLFFTMFVVLHLLGFPWRKKSATAEVNTNEASQQFAARERPSSDYVPPNGPGRQLFLEKAAEAGNEIAQYELAMLYSQAETKANNKPLEFKWMTLAAQQGYAPAQFQLGLLYGNGEVVPSDLRRAFEWHYKAAEQGYSDSQVNLFDAYQRGRGVQLDLVQAYKWLKVAIDKGETSHLPFWGPMEERVWDTPSMREMLERLNKEMTPEQIAEGERLANEFVCAAINEVEAN
jgi:TPR repeat protein